MGLMFTKVFEDMNKRELWLLNWALNGEGRRLGYEITRNFLTNEISLWSPFLKVRERRK